MFTFDFPLSPKARTYLKFEELFNKIEESRFLKTSADTLFFLRCIIDYIDLIDGSGTLKIEIQKDLEKIDSRLHLWEKDPDADTNLINELHAQIASARLFIERFSRQKNALSGDPILSNIKPRFLTPCGINCFDTPLFYYWNKMDIEDKINTIKPWLYEMDSIRTPIFTILTIWRMCSEFSSRVAKNGFMQETAEPCDFIAIRYPKEVKAYPVVSGFQSNINVRFLPYNKGAVVGDIEFELAYIRGTQI